jgi:PAS domain S-box-containing protein
MKKVIYTIKRFYKSLGLVEQSQVVASTAVVVSMATIITAHFVTGQTLGPLDFISIVTVGVFGFVSVYFSLKYGRQLEEERRELLALNTIAEAVNHSVELDTVLQSTLVKVMELMGADCGWIYLAENNLLVLRQSYGTSVKFFPPDYSLNEEIIGWIRQPGLYKTHDPKILDSTTSEFKAESIEALVSIPLVHQGMFAGVLIIAGKEARRFEAKEVVLSQTFGNQISVALHNASLFEQVKRSEQLYADLYEHSPDMYHSVNQNGKIVSCNLRESQLLGLPKEKIIGKHLKELYPSSQQEHVNSNLTKIFEHGKELKGMEEQIQTSDRTLIDVSVSTSLVYGPDGKPILARMVLRDITEKKKMESKILQAQKIDSIGNLAGGIAHDFNNILTSILGAASIMRRKIKDDERWMKYVELIETTSRRGAALTRQLLTFARKTNPNIRLIDMNSVIDETIRLFGATTPKTIHIKVTLAAEPVFIEADEGQLQQALLNLCLNARDAMPKGGILSVSCNPVHIDLEQARQFADGKAGEYVMVSVIDSGVGIPANVLNRIFEPFFTTKEQGKGTGLGLSVVYGVIRSHNGYINVQSEVDSGTVFTLYLPRVSNSRLMKPSIGRATEVVGGTERILLIEDEISVGEVGVDILKDLGYTVEVAKNGKEAVQLLTEKRQPFHLVILDMNMPRVGGRTTFDFIKKQFPDLKVLVCSGYSATMLDDGKFVQSIDGFIQKPYELEDFARKIRSILDPGVTAPQPPV